MNVESNVDNNTAIPSSAKSAGVSSRWGKVQEVLIQPVSSFPPPMDNRKRNFQQTLPVIGQGAALLNSLF
jgi:hypothetical protein